MDWTGGLDRWTGPVDSPKSFVNLLLGTNSNSNYSNQLSDPQCNDFRTLSAHILAVRLGARG